MPFHSDSMLNTSSHAAHSVTTKVSSGIQVPAQPPGYSVHDMQLAGACDWFKIQKLVQGESRLISLLRKDGLNDEADRLTSMRDDLLMHRMAVQMGTDQKQFLRQNCANDAYISKWRREIDNFDSILAKSLKKVKLPPDHAIELRFQAQLLKQQAKASLPFTGYYNSVSKPPEVKPNIFQPAKYKPRFVYTPSAPRPELLKILGATAKTPMKVASFL